MINCKLLIGLVYTMDEFMCVSVILSTCFLQGEYI